MKTTDFLHDLEKITQSQALVSAFSSNIPLAPVNNGRSIDINSLEMGDIILSTTADPFISGTIRKITKSKISHAAIYIGDGKLVEAVENGVQEKNVATALADDTVAVAFRHQFMNPEKAENIKKFLLGKVAEEAKYDKFGVVRNLPVQLLTSVCASLAPELRERCRNFAGRIFLGTESNNEFYCSELVFEAFTQAGLHLTNTTPQWTSPEDMVQLTYNGTLRYVGHLKI